ncbi:MAG: LTA synthase family protein [Oligosphaeraceae bacterium]
MGLLLVSWVHRLAIGMRYVWGGMVSLSRCLVPGRFRVLVPLCVVGLVVSLVTRLTLCGMSWGRMERTWLGLCGAFAVGLAYDLAVQGALLWPLSAWLGVMPRRSFRRAASRVALFGWLVSLVGLELFGAVSEGVFWEEFESRFNFIAVDYLAYTTEVLGNIWESYPVMWLLGGVALLSLGVVWSLWRGRPARLSLRSWTGWRVRLWFVAAHGALTVAGLWLLAVAGRPTFGGNRYLSELSGNGVYSLVAAFRQNRLDYEQFYATKALPEVDRLVRAELSAEPYGFVSDGLLDIRRRIAPGGEERRWNVVVVLEESLSASFCGALNGRGRTWTPNFDRLSEGGLLLSRCFASGTRTVRGIEAVQLSVPPTPGQSIVKRPGHEGLFSLGRLFRERGYSTTFLYGGNGFFDNMNAFFAANGYEVQDRNSPLSRPQTFSNAWGSCDGDVFRWALDAADRAYQSGRPFHQFILTTSNHRPYTFPAGLVEGAQGSRSAAVRYSDYALGSFVREAESRPWFGSTLFVVVADHCHSTSGREALPLGKYHIPVLFYNPSLVPARRVETVCSQIDVAPTLFGLLNWSYVSEFYGLDVSRLPASRGRAFPGTFQHLGLLDGATGELTTLYVRRRHDVRQWSLRPPFEDGGLTAGDGALARAVGMYQSASLRWEKRLDRVFAGEGRP